MSETSNRPQLPSAPGRPIAAPSVPNLPPNNTPPPNLAGEKPARPKTPPPRTPHPEELPLPVPPLFEPTVPLPVKQKIPRPPVDNMPTTGITAIVNPLAALKGGKTKVSIYSQLANNTLGFEQRYLGDTTNKPKGYAGENTPVTKFKNPSSLVSVVLDDVVNVFGVSLDKKNTDRTGTLCMLNPVYEETDTIIESGVIAGCSDGDSEGWIFYQATFNEDKQERMYITEQSLTGSRSSATRLEELRPILADTRLAACYDGEHRWLAYQGADNSVILRNIDRKKEAVLEDTEYTALPKTPLGVVHVPRANERDQIFVYFIHRDGSLRRAFLEIDDIVDFKGYGKETLVEKSDRVSRTSQLSIIADAGCRTNHIYAVKELKGPGGVTSQQVTAFVDNYGVSIQRLEELHHRNQHQHRFPYPIKHKGYHHDEHHWDSETVRSDHSHGHGHTHGYGFRPKHFHHDYAHDYGIGHHLGHMGDMEFDVGKVNMNALLKLHLGEPRVEYNRHLHNKYY